MIQMVEGGAHSTTPTSELASRRPDLQRPRYNDREREERPSDTFFSSIRPFTTTGTLELITERGKQELVSPFEELLPATQSQRPPAAAPQSYSYMNMNLGARPNGTAATAATRPTTTTERERFSRPDFTEVHRTPFFQGLNLGNPFKNEFEEDFEMTKSFPFPSFSSQMDYDENPYGSPRTPEPSPPVQAAFRVAPPTTSRPSETLFQAPEPEPFSEADILIPHQPGPSPPAEFLVKIPPPQLVTTERTFYRYRLFHNYGFFCSIIRYLIDR
jgi:hypothetical protein